VLLKTATTRTLVPDETAKIDKEIFETTVEPKYEFIDYGATVEMKLQTSNVLSVTASKSDLFIKGFKLSVNGIQEFPTIDIVQQTINLGAEYRHEKFLFKATGGYPLENRPLPIRGTFVVQPVDKVFVGSKFNFDYNPTDGKLDKFMELKVAGSSGSTRGHLTGTLDKKVGVFVNHSLNDSDTVGLCVRAEFPSEKPVTEAILTTTSKKSEPKAQPMKLSFDLAGQHKINKFTALSGKLSVQQSLGEEKKPTGIRFGFGFQQSLNSKAVGTLAADINIASLLGNTGGSGHSLGFELKLKD